MNTLQKELTLEKYINFKVEKLEIIADDLDEIFDEELQHSKHGSETHKQAQRKSNAMLRIKQAIEILKHEL